MTLEAAVQQAIGKAVQNLRAQQSNEGYWLGEWKGLSMLLSYGAALVQCGHDPRSEVLQDICDEVERCRMPDGGFAHCPESDSQPVSSYLARLFLRRCRPESSALRGVDEYLERTKYPETPAMLVMNWILDVEGREQLLDFHPPPGALRRLAWRLGVRLMRGESPGDNAPSAKMPPWYRRRLEWRAAQALSWPTPEAIEGQLRGETVPPVFGLWAFSAVYALQLLSGHRPFAKGKERTARFVEPYFAQHTYDDGSSYYLFFLPYMLVCLQALGRTEDEAKMRRAVEAISYRKGGWMGSTMIGINVLDTALVVQGMIECGVPKHDPTIARGCAFLDEARTDQGIWTWAWQRSAGRRFREGDTDDSGAVLIALQAAGHPTLNRMVADACASLLAAQRPDGSVATFTAAWGALNPCEPSNTGRALRGLVALGVSPDNAAVQRGLAWIAGKQRDDGSWHDYWLPGPLYGTTLALEALVDLGYRSLTHPQVKRAVEYVTGLQNADGGWGFDFYGQRLSRSRVEHTALGAFVLMRFSPVDERPTEAIRKAIRFLVDAQRDDGQWDASYVGNFNNIDGYANALMPAAFVLRALAAYCKLPPSP